jgi:fructose-1,6-bisphosphatase
MYEANGIVYANEPQGGMFVTGVRNMDDIAPEGLHARSYEYPVPA